MTMLELLELQARARAIRSQLALEPVTKIDLSDDEKEDTKIAETSKTPVTPVIEAEKLPSQKPVEEDILVVKMPEIPPPPPSKPVKIKRNYKGQLVVPEKPKSTEKDEDVQSDSSDIITIDPNLETYFISDSEDEGETPTKNVVEEIIEKPAENEVEKVVEEPEEGEVNSTENSPEKVDEIPIEDDVVNLMSDTEIDTAMDEGEKSEDDGNIVDIQVGENETIEAIDESDKEATKKSETWEDRWLSSSKTQKVLRTTRIASKVRENVLKTKKSQKEKEKKKIEKEKAIREKITNAEEGSMEQFETLKEKSD